MMKRKKTKDPNQLMWFRRFETAEFEMEEISEWNRKKKWKKTAETILFPALQTQAGTVTCNSRMFSRFCFLHERRFTVTGLTKWPYELGITWVTRTPYGNTRAHTHVYICIYVCIILHNVHDIMQYTLVSVSRHHVGALVKRIRMDSWLEYMD